MLVLLHNAFSCVCFFGISCRAEMCLPYQEITRYLWRVYFVVSIWPLSLLQFLYHHQLSFTQNIIIIIIIIRSVHTSPSTYIPLYFTFITPLHSTLLYFHQSIPPRYSTWLNLHHSTLLYLHHSTLFYINRFQGMLLSLTLVPTHYDSAPGERCCPHSKYVRMLCIDVTRLVWFDMKCFTCSDLIWFDLIWFDLIWFGYNDDITSVIILEYVIM